MSSTQTGFESVLHRANTDESFLARLRDDPKGALAPYDLDEEAERAIIEGDERGIDEVLGDLATTVYTVTLVLIYRKG